MQTPLGHWLLNQLKINYANHITYNVWFQKISIPRATEGFSSLTPHPSGFSVPEGLAVLLPTSPENSTMLSLGPRPLGKSICTKKKRDSGHLYLFYHHLSKVSKCAVQVDENVFRGPVLRKL